MGGVIVASIAAALRTRESVSLQLSTYIPEGVKAVVKGIEDPAAIVDSSFVVRVASKTAAQYLMSKGATVADPQLRALVRRVRDSGDSETATLSVTRQGRTDGQRLATVRVMAVSPRMMMVVLRDITERERVEQMRRDFVANISHELKTPVAAVSVLSEAIVAAADDPDVVRKFAARLRSEAKRLDELTTRIMSLSRLQAAEDLSEERDVSIDQVIASAVAALATQAESAGVSVVTGGDKNAIVRGDERILTDALGNLLNNAIAYSPRGSKVGVGVRAEADSVEVTVTDRGIGIPEADQERIFERFYRADQARSRRTGGTGLGLAIVKHAAQRHGGEVRIWSQPGRGSTFTMQLPLRRPDEKASKDGHPKGGQKKYPKKNRSQDKDSARV